MSTRSSENTSRMLRMREAVQSSEWHKNIADIGPRFESSLSGQAERPWQDTVSTE